MKQPEQEPPAGRIANFGGDCLFDLFTGCLFDGCLGLAFSCLAGAAILYWLV